MEVTIPVEQSALPTELQTDPPQTVVIETHEPTVESIEEVQTVADKILEDTQWLREQVTTRLVEVHAQLQALKTELTTSPIHSSQADLMSEVSSLRQELRNLKEQLASLKTEPSVPSNLSMAEPPVTGSEVPADVEEGHQVPATPKNKRRKI